MSYTIMRRSQRLVNTDPQRRCYNGCHFSSELVWTDWEVLDSAPTQEQASNSLKFWAELNDCVIIEAGAA